MIEQQRQQLAMMGIDLWIPRHAAVRSISVADTLWRDVDIGQSDRESVKSERVEAIVRLKADVLKQVDQPLIPTAEKIIENAQAVETSPTTIIRNIETVDTVPAFQLQVLFAEQFILLVDQQQLTSHTLPLWQNIQQALHLQDASLQWPFPLANLQEPSGLHDYVQGFLDVVATEKSIFCLGELPVSLKFSCQIVASLPDMLQQPLLKQQLWKLIQPLRL